MRSRKTDLDILSYNFELVKKLSQLLSAQLREDEIQKKRTLDDAKQREQQMNRERDEKRKKDF